MVAERSETLPLQELVSFERRDPFLTIILPSDSIRLCFIENESQEVNLRKEKNVPEGFFDEEFELKRIELSEDGQGPYILISSQATTYTLKEPKRMSPGSEAKYLAEFESDGVLFLLQYLDGQTSRHQHPDIELFGPVVKGRPSFSHNSKVEKVEEIQWLPSNEYHEAFSLKEPTLTAIVQPVNVNHDADPKGKSDLEEMRAKARVLT